MKIDVLDHGYVKFIEGWGFGEAGVPEAGIIESARQSTQGSFRGWEQDKKLLKFLYDHKHDSVFEFAGMVVEIQAPIMVFREHQRHRSQSYSEMSARYAPLPDLNYVPTVERLMMKNDKNKQAGTIVGATILTEGRAREHQADLQMMYHEQESLYQDALQCGIPKELARLHLPVGRYSRMRAQALLRNWFAFLTLRMAPDTQWETRQFANAVGQIIAEKFPRTWALFNEGRKE